MTVKHYSINGTNRPSEIPLFSYVYYYMGEYAGINIGEDGEISITFIAPHLTEEEIRSFFEESFKIFSVPLNVGGTYKGIAIRGAITLDAIIDPNIISKKAIDNISAVKPVTCYLIDSAKDMIEGIRLIYLNERTTSFIKENLESILNNNVSTSEIKKAYEKGILSYSPKQLIKRSTLIGKSTGSSIPCVMLFA